MPRRDPTSWLPATAGLVLAAGCGAVDTVPPPVVINELVAASAGGEDWFELLLPIGAPVSLDGWSVGADAEGRRPLDPTLVLHAGTPLRIWADGGAEAAPDHVALRLDVDGETLTLFDPRGRPVDTVTWGPLLPDLALAREPDGSPDWAVRADSTPGALNGGTDRGLPAGPIGCTAAIAAGAPYGVEGEPISRYATCDGGEVDWTWFGPRAAEGSSHWEWTPELDQAGDWDVLAVARSTTAAGVPSTARTEVQIADAWSNPDNVPVDPLTYTSEWDLPVLHLDVGGVDVPQEYVPADAWFDGVHYTAQIKVRGAASAGYPKHNYTVEFDPVQIDLGDVGLQPKDHLVLISNFDDNSHVRQRLVYDTWATIAAFSGAQRLAPRTFALIVYLDGAYLGLYLGIDHVDDEFLREMGLTDGGDLYKSVSHDANYYSWNAGGAPKGTLHDGWEKKEGDPLDDFASIEELTAWSFSTPDPQFAAEVDGRIATDEFIDWFHLVRALACDDSAGKNAYLYAEPESGRFRYAPWDFNHSVGQTWQTARQSPEGVSDYTWNNGIFAHFQADPALSATLWDRFDQLRAAGAPLSLDAELALVEAYADELGPNIDRDWEKWSADYQAYGLWSWRTDWTTPAEEHAYVVDWLTARAAAL